TLTIAYLGDRLKRVRLLGLQVFVAGVFSFLTGRATGIWSFGAARAGFDLGEDALGSGVPTTSLQADYYPPEVRGKVFALRGVTAFALTAASPLMIGALVDNLGWRTPYAIGGVTAVLASLLVFTLKEPVRGYMERKSLGASEEEAVKPQEVPSLGEAWRSIWGIRTLRRLFIASIPGTAGSFTFTFYFAILMFEHYHLSIFQISVLTTVLAVAALPFGFLGGGVVDVLIRRRPHRVLLFTGILGFTAAPVVAVIALGPPLWVIVAMLISYAAVGSLISPARQVLFAQILPAHVRTLGLSLDTLAGIPGTILRIYTIGFFVSRWGTQGGMFAVVPFFLLTAIIQMSAAGLFERDMKAAMASQFASEEYRRARERGRGKLLVCRDVDVEYDGVQVLFGVDFDVEEGQIIAVLGTNGAGKSTLLKAVSGVQEASGGAIVLDGRDITHMPPPEIAARGVVHMPGGRGIFPGLTVKENLMLGGWSSSEDNSKSRLDGVFE
ncbi:MAG: MFS transporter, partial [Acidimicrobiia bacterium]